MWLPANPQKKSAKSNPRKLAPAYSRSINVTQSVKADKTYKYVALCTCDHLSKTHPCLHVYIHKQVQNLNSWRIL